MIHLYSTVEQLTERRDFLKQKIEKHNDPFLTYGWSRQLQEVEQKLALLLEQQSNSEPSPQLQQTDVSGRSEQLKGGYTAHFTQWREKYFEDAVVLPMYKSKASGDKYTDDDLHRKYRKAMGAEPFNCH